MVRRQQQQQQQQQVILRPQEIFYNRLKRQYDDYIYKYRTITNELIKTRLIYFLLNIYNQVQTFIFQLHRDFWRNNNFTDNDIRNVYINCATLINSYNDLFREIGDKKVPIPWWDDRLPLLSNDPNKTINEFKTKIISDIDSKIYRIKYRI